MASLIVLLSALFVLAHGSHLSNVHHGSFPEPHEPFSVGHGSHSVGREYLPVEHGSIPIGHGSAQHYGFAAPYGHHPSVTGSGFPHHHGHVIAHGSVPAQHVVGSVAPDSYHQVAAPGSSTYHHHLHGALAPIVAGTGHAHVHQNRNCHATIHCPNSISRTYASDGHYCYRLNNPCDLAIANCKRRNELKPILRHISHGECHHLPRGQRPY
ncbi:GL23575 [Drosophila persimilis]|uniref:GL23575 n=1 Tax=Drosophila persimilis TaxID=7234 RepID=B4G2M9_DROPE|nr:GL23575 [Drosophila persimilis]